MSIQSRISALSAKTQNAYAVNRFRSWDACVRELILRGYDDAEVEAVLRSKWMRWASDQANGKATVKHLKDFLDNPANCCDKYAVKALVKETF
jgi:hypothetical protein